MQIYNLKFNGILYNKENEILVPGFLNNYYKQFGTITNTEYEGIKTEIYISNIKEFITDNKYIVMNTHDYYRTIIIK